MDCELLLLHENMKIYKGYEAVTGLMLADEEGLPPYLCTNCADQLMNCAHFRHRSLQAHLMLLDILKSHDRITLKSIRDVIKISPEHDITEKDPMFTEIDKVKIEDVVIKTEINHETIESEEVNIDIKAEIHDVQEECDAEIVNDEIGNDDVIGLNLYEVPIMPSVEYINDMIKENGLEASIHNVDDSELGTGEDGSLDDGPSGQEDQLNAVAREGIDVTEDFNGMEVTEHNYKGHFLAFDDKTYSLDTCKSSFPQDSGMLIHSSDKSYSCEFCDETYYDECALKNHLRSHSNEKEILDDVCEKVFREKKIQDALMKVQATKKTFLCDICKKILYTKQGLQIHVNSHYGEKPFTCGMCHSSFSQKCHYKNHLLIHSGDKPFTCETCNKSFNSKPNYQRHLNTHTGEKPYTCDVCKRSFGRNSILKRHMIVHSGDKPYPCNICNKSYSRKYQFRIHMLKHGGEKAYSCLGAVANKGN